jgi:hypothetical protein
MNDRKEDDNLGSFYMGRMRPPPEPDRKLPRGFLTAVTVLAFLGIIWYAYPQGQEKYTDVDVPVVTADTEPYKTKPQDPGGMEVRHQDSTVFDSLGKPSPELEGKKAKLNLEPQMKAEPKPAPVVEPVKKEEPKKEEPKFAAAPEPVNPGSVYIQLGAYKDVAGAKKDWGMMQGKYPQLKGLSMRTQKADLGSKGTLYRLQAGVKTDEKAKDICAALKKGGAACLVVK